MCSSLNAADKEHVDARIEELKLDWDRDATYAEISERCTDVPEGDYPRNYEVSQHQSKSARW